MQGLVLHLFFSAFKPEHYTLLSYTIYPRKCYNYFRSNPAITALPKTDRQNRTCGVSLRGRNKAT